MISGAGDRVREGCDYRDEQEEQRSERCAGGGRRRAPTVLSRIRQGGPDRRREPHEVEDRQAGKHRSDQNPRAIAAVERGECVGRRADLRLIAVDDVRDDEEDDELDAAVRHKRSQNAGVVYTLVDEVMAVVDALMIVSP